VGDILVSLYKGERFLLGEEQIFNFIRTFLFMDREMQDVLLFILASLILFKQYCS